VTVTYVVQFYLR